MNSSSGRNCDDAGKFVHSSGCSASRAWVIADQIPVERDPWDGFIAVHCPSCRELLSRIRLDRAKTTVIPLTCPFCHHRFEYKDPTAPPKKASGLGSKRRR